MGKEAGFYSWANKQQFVQAIQNYGEDAMVNEGLQSTASTFNNSRTFVNYDTNISVKSDFSGIDMDWFRPSERIPLRTDHIIHACNHAYKRIGIVRNMIDLMSDFASTGIRIQHTNPQTNRFLNRWFKKVKGENRTERFLSLLYREANVVVKSDFGKITRKDEKALKRVKADLNDDGLRLESPPTKTRTIPLEYIFLSPRSLEVIGAGLSTFVGKPKFAIKITQHLRSSLSDLTRITNSRGSMHQHHDELQMMLGKLPANIKQMIQGGAQSIPLDEDKISVYYYKKDDWELWATPMIYSILSDLLTLEKMQLADRAALDGAISNVRLWTVGILDGANSILPNRAMINKIRNILANSNGGGTLDMVWGPELSFTESNSQVYKFLGSEKFTQTLDAIYDGMGYPSVLRSSGGASSNSSSFTTLRTLVERLEYGRSVVTDFWQEQLKIVMKAMDFDGEAHIVFDRMILSDEAAEKKLLMDMVDRNIISEEDLMEHFGLVPDIVNKRVNQEHKKRGKSMPHKASPYHTAQQDHELRKIVLQGGGATPSEVGLELEERKEGEKTRVEEQGELQRDMKEMDVKRMSVDNKTSKPGGRPKNITETNKRKPRPSSETRTAKSFVNLFIWGNGAQASISEIVTPAVLGAYDKKNVRSLSRAQTQELEDIKFGVLCTLEAYDTISTETVYNSMNNNNPIDAETKQMIVAFRQEFALSQEREPTIDEIRQMQSTVYAIQNEEE